MLSKSFKIRINSKLKIYIENCYDNFNVVYYINSYFLEICFNKRWKLIQYSFCFKNCNIYIYILI